MERSNEDSYEIYREIGIYIILGANSYFFLYFLLILFPYIAYEYRNNKVYLFIRDRVPFIQNQVLILEKEAKARKNWNKLRHIIKALR